MDKCPAKNDKIPHRVYNLGNDKPEKLVKLIELIEYHTGKKAIRKLQEVRIYLRRVDYRVRILIRITWRV